MQLLVQWFSEILSHEGLGIMFHATAVVVAWAGAVLGVVGSVQRMDTYQ